MEIPKEVKNIIQKLEGAGFEAYVVGGCVRDLFLGKEPNDWDVATSASPEEIKNIFPESYYENQFLTVTVLTKSKKESLREIEVTTFRSEAKYSDKRHPDKVEVALNLEQDLSRRDFTVNAIALKYPISIRQPADQYPNNSQISKSQIENREYELVDPFNGRDDLRNKIIRAVGNAEQRFGEDALRLMRAVRFACVLDFKIESKTLEAIKKNAGWLQAIAKERVRDELVKMIMSERASEGIELLRETGLLKYVIPELEKGVGVSQNRHHIYTVYEHCLYSLKFAAEKKFNLEVRLAALLHDIAKPQAKAGEGPDSTFYNHDFLSAKFAARILERLRFSNDQIQKICLLIRNHMFVYEVGVVTEAAVRRLLRRVGPENMKDLIAVRVADRLGSGVPKAQPYRLRHFQYMVEKVQHDPISAKMLKVDGNDIMKILKVEPGPKIGAILDVLLAEVIEDPKKNEKEILERRVWELADEDLAELRKLAKGKIEEKKEEEDAEIKGRYWVQ